eukprot:TRINITY_DN43193_c0_g1_i3.p2 TRINITY_DN43193_c0_g1~~TRINITY_DN43193_c0_g1_i3.p2  ORF type:complete len:314 (-),score=50.75 TRINITY_DN43193_c0_g1_i3:310-1251(-)
MQFLCRCWHSSLDGWLLATASVKRYEEAACQFLLAHEAVHDLQDAAKLSSCMRLANSGDLRGLLDEYSLTKREVEGVHLVLLSLTLADLPLVAIATYIIIIVGASDVMVVVALILSAMAAGGKASSLGKFNSSVKSMRTLETAFISQIFVHRSLQRRTASLKDGMRHMCASHSVCLEAQRLGGEKSVIPAREILVATASGSDNEDDEEVVGMQKPQKSPLQSCTGGTTPSDDMFDVSSIWVHSLERDSDSAKAAEMPTDTIIESAGKETTPTRACAVPGDEGIVPVRNLLYLLAGASVASQRGQEGEEGRIDL